MISGTDTGLAATLAQRPDADRVRLRLGTAFIEHAADLWPEGEPAATPEWIRAHAFDILAVLEKGLRRDGHDVRRLPHRLHWVLWLLADLGQDWASRRA
jgi:hypothetical protein